MIRTCLAFFLTSVLASTAMAQMSITITKVYEDKTNIAVVPFLWDGASTAPSEMSNIVVANLERTGQFAALPQSDMRSWPTRRESMVFREWRLLDQDFVVIGRARGLSDDRVEVAYELYDPYREVRILGETLTGSRSQWRELA
ncbi:MAG: Tol-Pal system protein TolB, partial [Natronospirillum sp.]